MSAPIRVMFVVQDFVIGGAERHLIELWRRIDRSRFSIEIACLSRRGPLAEEAASLGWPVHDLGVGRRIYGPAGFRGLARLVHHVAAFRPHVIHGYLMTGGLFATIAGRAAGVPAVVIAKRNVDSFETPRQRAVHGFAHRLATHVTAVSRAVASSAEGLGVAPSRITVIPNGVDTARYAPAQGAAPAVAGNGHVPLIGSVGCLAPRKDYATLIEALAHLDRSGRRFRVLIVGDGPEREALEARARARGLGDRMTFAGERADVASLLPTMDVFVLSSREEGIPNALLEAMAAGRAVVATAVGGTPEVVSGGETGWLVPPGVPERLAEALEQALDPAEAARRGSAARRAMIERMDIGVMVRAHERFYAAIAAGRAA